MFSIKFCELRIAVKKLSPDVFYGWPGQQRIAPGGRLDGRETIQPPPILPVLSILITPLFAPPRKSVDRIEVHQQTNGVWRGNGI